VPLAIFIAQVAALNYFYCNERCGEGTSMWRVLGTALFLIPIAMHCWLMKKSAWPSYKGYAVLSVIRTALMIGTGVAALWGMAGVALIVIMAVLAVSFLVPVTRPKLNS
jgi:hypothetical protein